MGTALVAALLITGIVGAIISVAITIAAEKKAEALVSGVTATAALVVANTIIFYWTLPTFGATSAMFWRSNAFWIILVEAACLVAFVQYRGDDQWNGFTHNPGAYAVIVVIVLALVTQTFAGTWNDGNATKLASNLKVTIKTPDGDKVDLTGLDSPDPDHVIKMSPDMAMKKAERGLSELRNITVGTWTGSASTAFKVVNGGLRSIGNHAYYLFPLNPSSRQNASKVGHVIPGYIQVDAENPSAPSKNVLTDNDNNPLAIKCSPNFKRGHDVGRIVWSKYHSQMRDQPMFDINDQGRPYYVVGLNDLTVNRQPGKTTRVVILDAQTCAVLGGKPLALADAPDWVDVLLSPETVTNYINWWCHYGQAGWEANIAGWWESKANRYQIDPDQPVQQVYSKSGRTFYQAVLTSRNNDAAASYLMMVDARTGEANVYQIPRLTLESVASSTINNGLKAAKSSYVAVYPTFYVIKGYVSWVSPLESSSDKNHIYQGMAIVNAADPDGTSFGWGKTMDDATASYDAAMAIFGAGQNGVKTGASDLPATGTIKSIAQEVEPSPAGSKTVYYVVLNERPATEFRVEPSVANREVRYTKEKRHVVIMYRGTATDTLVTAKAFNDLELPMVK